MHHPAAEQSPHDPDPTACTVDIRPPVVDPPSLAAVSVGSNVSSPERRRQSTASTLWAIGSISINWHACWPALDIGRGTGRISQLPTPHGRTSRDRRTPPAGL